MIGPRGPIKGFKPPTFKMKPTNFKTGPVKGYNPNTFKPLKYPYLPGMYGSQRRNTQKSEPADIGVIMILVMGGISVILLLDRLYSYGIVMGVITGLALIGLINYKGNKPKPVKTAETEESISNESGININGTTISEDDLNMFIENFHKINPDVKASKEELKFIIENFPELANKVKEDVEALKTNVRKSEYINDDYIRNNVDSVFLDPPEEEEQ